MSNGILDTKLAHARRQTDYGFAQQGVVQRLQ
jgi:hypothetical protein